MTHHHVGIRCLELVHDVPNHDQEGNAVTIYTAESRCRLEFLLHGLGTLTVDQAVKSRLEVRKLLRLIGQSKTGVPDPNTGVTDNNSDDVEPTPLSTPQMSMGSGKDHFLEKILNPLESSPP